MARKIQFQFNAAFLPVLSKNERFKVLYGGVGSGKSFFATDYFIYRALTKKKQRILVIRKEATTHKESTWELFKDRLSFYELLDICSINKTDLKITFDNGSEIIFKGLDNSEKIKSISNIDAIYVEEATEITLSDFQQLNNRLRGKHRIRPEIFVLFNPVDMTNWVYNYFFKVGQKDSYILKTNYKDNLANLDDSYINMLEDYKRTDTYKYTTETLGNWGSRGQRVYTNWESKDFEYKDVIKDLRKRNVNFSSTIGVDFGFTNDPTTITCSLVNFTDKEIWIYDAYGSTGMLNDEIIDVFQHMNILTQPIYADSASPDMIANLKSLGARKIVGAKKHGDSGRLAGVQYIKGFKIYIKSSLKDVVHEFEYYSYEQDKSTGLYKNSPQDGNDHYLDGFRYSLTPFMSKKVATRINFTASGINV